MSDVPLTVATAAVELGVSPRRVRQLAARNQLDVIIGAKRVMVTSASVADRIALSPSRGRPWLPETVWAAAWLRDGREPTWLNERTLRRLRPRAKADTTAELLARLDPLATISRWGAPTGVLDAIRAEAGAAWNQDSEGTLTVCLPSSRAAPLPMRYALLPGHDLVLIGTTGYRPSVDAYVPSLLL